jgi:hypothetical protein
MDLPRRVEATPGDGGPGAAGGRCRRGAQRELGLGLMTCLACITTLVAWLITNNKSAGSRPYQARHPAGRESRACSVS